MLLCHCLPLTQQHGNILLTSYTAKPIVSRSRPSFLSFRLFFCIRAITTLQTSSSSSASSSSSLNCGLVQNVSADQRVEVKDGCIWVNIHVMCWINYQLADVVPAASSGGAADPVALKDVDLPVAFCVIIQGVGGHVANLHLVKIPFEVFKLHPGVQKSNTTIHLWINTSVFHLLDRLFQPNGPIKASSSIHSHWSTDFWGLGALPKSRLTQNQTYN